MEEKKIHLKVEETHRMKLEGLASSGYTWNHAVIGEAGVVSVSLDALSTSGDMPIGGHNPAEKLLIISGQTPGETTLRLRLQRSWETNKPPLKEILLKVTVSS